MRRALLSGDRGVVTTTIALTVGGLLLGGATAVGAVLAVVDAYGPQDETALVDGSQDVLPPEDILNYGG